MSEILTESVVGATRVTVQQTLFDENQHSASSAGAGDEDIVLYALGDFQARGKVLAERDLPLDRLRGAFKRATEKFHLLEFDDERLAATLTCSRRESEASSRVCRETPFSRGGSFRVGRSGARIC
ncbi:MAG: hypothetical protein WKF84_12995 [Pyrinomonadaceae bacterium]